MLIVGYCYCIRFERKLCEEVELHLAYRWFCCLALDDKVPHHSTFSVNRHGRFRDSDIFRELFEAVVRACMVAGSSRAKGSRSMRVSWKPMPAAITARRRTRSIGQDPSARRARSPNSWLVLMMKTPTRTSNRRR